MRRLWLAIALVALAAPRVAQAQVTRMPIASVGANVEGIDVPIAKNPDGSPVTGPVWDRFVGVAGNVNTQPIAGAAGRTPLTLDPTKAKLISATAETPAGVKSGVAAVPS